MVRLNMFALGMALSVLPFFTISVACAQEHGERLPSNDPAVESYRIAELQRQQNIDRMLLRIDQMRWSRLNYPSFLWGYPDVTFARQPVGQRHTQTGPNRWESHPVYGEPVRLPTIPPVSGPREF